MCRRSGWCSKLPRKRALATPLRVKSKCTQSRRRQSQGCVAFSRTRWPPKRINNLRICKLTIKCSLTKREPGRRRGLTTRKTWTRKRSREPTWATSWLRTQWPQHLNWPSTATSLTTSRDWNQSQLTKSTLLVPSKSKTTRQSSRMRKQRNKLGLCRTSQTLSISSTMRSS